jgi:glycosyltransferase involved in cell wall biosynthesis
MPMAKILILIGGHLCTSPRSQKEAETLANAGHDVIVRGVWFDPELVTRDRLLMANKQWKFAPIVDFQPTHRLTNWRIRLQTRIAKERYRRFEHFSPALLGYGARAMLKAARQACADLTIVHSEVGLWVGSQLLNQGLRVGVDFEDWFSEDLLPADRANRPIKQLKTLEARLIRECKYCLTTSHAMADAMATAYNALKPTVIYNSFPWAEREQIDHQVRDRQNLTLLSLHWFSQTIGPGRGLETLFQALPQLNQPVEVHLRGNLPQRYNQWLKALIPAEWQNYTFIHPVVPNAILLSRIAEHDVGLALEDSSISSRNLTVTNKIFQYLQAGLAVVATDTAGQKEVFSHCSKIGQLIPYSTPSALAQALTDLLNTPGKIDVGKKAALQVAKETFCWEVQAPTLIRLVEGTLN